MLRREWAKDRERGLGGPNLSFLVIVFHPFSMGPTFADADAQYFPSIISNWALCLNRKTGRLILRRIYRHWGEKCLGGFDCWQGRDRAFQHFFRLLCISFRPSYFWRLGNTSFRSVLFSSCLDENHSSSCATGTGCQGIFVDTGNLSGMSG